jgi:hypothetical protein
MSSGDAGLAASSPRAIISDCATVSCSSGSQLPAGALLRGHQPREQLEDACAGRLGLSAVPLPQVVGDADPKVQRVEHLRQLGQLDRGAGDELGLGADRPGRLAEPQQGVRAQPAQRSSQARGADDGDDGEPEADDAAGGQRLERDEVEPTCQPQHERGAGAGAQHRSTAQQPRPDSQRERCTPPRGHRRTPVVVQSEAGLAGGAVSDARRRSGSAARATAPSSDATARSTRCSSSTMSSTPPADSARRASRSATRGARAARARSPSRGPTGAGRPRRPGDPRLGGRVAGGEVATDSHGLGLPHEHLREPQLVALEPGGIGAPLGPQHGQRRVGSPTTALTYGRPSARPVATPRSPRARSTHGSSKTSEPTRRGRHPVSSPR